MNAQAAFCLVNEVLELGLGAFFLWQYGRRRVARIFAFLCLCSGLWVGEGVVYFGAFSDGFRGAYFDCFSVFPPLCIAAALHLVFAFCEAEGAFDRWMLRAAYALAPALAAADLFACPPWLYRLHPGANCIFDEYQGAPRLLTAYLLVFMAYGFLPLVRSLWNRSGVVRNRQQVMLAAWLLCAVLDLASSGNNWMAIVSDDISYVFVAYLIAKHRPFNLAFAFRKGEAAALAGLGLALAAAGGLILADWAARWAGIPRRDGLAAAGVLLAAGLPFLYRSLDRRARRWLRIRDFNSVAVQSEYSNLLIREPNLDAYLAAVLEKLRGDLGLTRAGFFWRTGPEGGWDFQRSVPEGWHPDLKASEAPLLRRAAAAFPNGLDVEEWELSEEPGRTPIERAELLGFMKRLDCRVAFPLLREGKLRGLLLLGHKANGRIFSPDEFRFLGVLKDHLDVATERGRLQERLEASDHAARHCALTGLPNRKHLEESLDRMLREGGPDAEVSLALLFLDLDLFKWVNDNLGHAAGDRVLVIAAERMRHCVSRGDLVARLGGDEFVIVARVERPEEAQALCHRLLRSISGEMDLGGAKVRVGSSIGVALFPRDARDRADLMRKADEALYAAKVPRNAARFYGEDVGDLSRERAGLKADLIGAVGRGELRVHYQPVRDLRESGVVRAEALLRWAHPARGLLAAGAFVGLVDELGMQEEVQTWEFDRVVLQGLEWAGRGFGPLALAVNLSPGSLEERGLAARMARVLDRHRGDPRRFQLEIPESAAMKHGAAFAEFVGPLKERGMAVFLDGFSGHAGIAVLRRLGVDGIKMDRSLTAGIGSDPDREAVLKAGLSLGGGLGLEVVAQGVEREEQLDFLRAAGFTHAQGTLLGGDQAPADFARDCLERGAAVEQRT